MDGLCRNNGCIFLVADQFELLAKFGLRWCVRRMELSYHSLSLWRCISLAMLDLNSNLSTW